MATVTAPKRRSKTPSRARKAHWKKLLAKDDTALTEHLAGTYARLNSILGRRK